MTMWGVVGTEKYAGIIAYQRTAESEWNYLIFKSRPGELNWKWVIEPAYKQARFAGEELLMVENNDGKCGILNMTGQIVVPFRYDAIGDFCDGIAAVRKDGQEFYIKEDGQPLINTVFQKVFDFAEGMGAVCQDSLWGYIDTSGAFVIDCQYDEAGVFREGMAAVSVDGKSGHILIRIIRW